MFKSQEQIRQPQLITLGPWEEIHSGLIVAKDRLVSIGVNSATGYLRTTTLPKITDDKVRMWLSLVMTKLEAKWKETKDLNDAITIIDDAIAYAGKKAGLIKDEPEKKEKKDEDKGKKEKKEEKNEKKEKKKEEKGEDSYPKFAEAYSEKLRNKTGSSAYNCVTLPMEVLEEMGAVMSKFPGGSNDFVNGGRLLSQYSSEGYGSNSIKLLTWSEMKKGVESGTIKNGSLIMRLDPISKVKDLSPWINANDKAITAEGDLVTPEYGIDAYICRHYISVAYDNGQPKIVHASGNDKKGWTVKDQSIGEFGSSFSGNTSSETRYVVVDLAKLFPELKNSDRITGF